MNSVLQHLAPEISQMTGYIKVRMVEFPKSSAWMNFQEDKCFVYA